MDEQKIKQALEKLEQAGELTREFLKLAKDMEQAKDKMDGMEVFRLFIKSARQAKKIADKYLQYSEEVEDIFGL